MFPLLKCISLILFVSLIVLQTGFIWVDPYSDIGEYLVFS